MRDPIEVTSAMFCRATGKLHVLRPWDRQFRDTGIALEVWRMLRCANCGEPHDIISTVAHDQPVG